MDWLEEIAQKFKTKPEKLKLVRLAETKRKTWFVQESHKFNTKEEAMKFAKSKGYTHYWAGDKSLDNVGSL